MMESRGQQEAAHYVTSMFKLLFIIPENEFPNTLTYSIVLATYYVHNTQTLMIGSVISKSRGPIG